MLQQIKNFWLTITLRRKLSSLDRTATRLSREIHQVNRQMVEKERVVSLLQSQIDSEVKQVRELSKRSTALNKQLESALEAARDEIKNLREIVVPGLVAANLTFQQAWDAQSARSAMQTAAVEMKDET